MAVAFVAYAVAGSTNATDVTTSGIDTTGATFLAVILADRDGAGTVSDSKGNTYVKMTPQVTGTVDGAVSLHYCLVPTVGPGHTFTGTGAYPSVAATAFSGTTGFALDSDDGSNSEGTGGIIVGPLTPPADGALFISGYADRLPFGGGGPSVDWILDASVQTVGGQHFAVSSAHLIQATAAAQNVGWSCAPTFVTGQAAVIAVFSTPAVQPTCYGGGEIEILADPASGETFTGRTISPRAWLTLAFDDADRSIALDTYNHPASYYNGQKVGHVVTFGSITRQLSDRFSSYKMADCSVEVDDSSRLFSTLEDTAASQYWYNREVRAYLASTTTIAAAGVPHVLFRGIWTGHTSTGMKRTLRLTDVLGSEFSDLNLERSIPDEKIGTNFPLATPEMRAKVVPIAMGKWVDASGVTGDPVTGVTAVAVPSVLAAPSGFTATWGSGGALFDAGDFRNIGNGFRLYYALTAVVSGLESLPAYADATATASDGHIDLAWSAYPGASEMRLYVSFRSDFLQMAELSTALAGATTSMVDATGGTRTDVNVLDVWEIALRMNVDYFVWAKLAGGVLSRMGQAASSPAVMFTPVSMERDRTALVTWDQYPDNLGYIVVRRRDYYSNWGREYDARWELSTDVNSLTDIMTAAVDAVVVPDVPTGCLPLLDVGHKAVINGALCRGLLLCKGAIQHVEEVYISRAIQGVGSYSPTDATTFNLVPEDAYGVTWYAPGMPGWSDVSAEQYIDINGNWYTLVYTSVDPLPVSIRVNACTRTDTSDGTGSVITGAARGSFHLLTQEILPPTDEVWTSGDYLDPREFDDGVPIINSASFAAAEAIEVDRLAGSTTAADVYVDGYQLQLYLDSPTTIRELLARFLSSFDLRFGQNQHGQLIAMHLDEFTVLSSTRQVSDAREIQIDTSIDRRLSELENRVKYDWGWRPAAGTFDSPGAQVSDSTAIAANRGRAVSGDTLEFLMTRDAATVSNVAGWRLAFGKYPPRYVTMVGPLHWLGISLGEVIRATDAEGVGATGWVDQPLWVVGIETTIGDLESAPTVKLTCIDVARFLAAYGVWAGDGVADWASASTTERATYDYWAFDTDLMSDGAPAKVWS